MVNWNGINIGILICYDLDFPETLQSLALKGAKFVPVLTATADMQYDNISKIVVPAKALENQLYLAYTNYVGGPYIGLRPLIKSTRPNCGLCRFRAGDARSSDLHQNDPVLLNSCNLVWS